MYNKAILMGRIAHDLELKTAGQTQVCSFRIAVERKYQKKGEERKSDFFTIVAWGNTAEFVNRYFSKGRMILVEGELQTRSYTNAEGVEINVTEIKADNISFTGEKAQSAAEVANSTPEVVTQAAAANIPIQTAEYPASDVDEYPF